jgi:serine protease Do
VGNPYGLDESVTQGIISAKGRRGSENISDLFQTDAAINPGNSGGPLVNVRGELIGINEAIFSESGGWQGVGFAIPAATVRATMDSILKTGRVIHGYLGILQQPADEDALRQRGLANEKGVLVDSVVTGSPAEKANIEPGDFIQRFNHRAINDFQDLRHSVAEVEVDTTVPIELLRNGKRISVNAQIAEKPPREAQITPGPQIAPPSTLPMLPALPSLGRRGSGRAPLGPDAESLAGVEVADLNAALVRTLNLPRDVQGVVVKRVDPGTPAADKLQLGDIIERVNQQSIASVGDFDKLVRSSPENVPLVLSIVRERTRILVPLSRS